MIDSAEITNYFSQRGLNLCAIFSTARLPSTISQAIAAEVADFERYSRLVLLGNAGAHLWRFFERNGMERVDPFDRHSAQVAAEFASDALNQSKMRLLYPGDSLIPLQQLGKLAGWHHDSPLGLGIHSIYGVWFAYRAAFLVEADLPLMYDAPTPSPCASCDNKPCITACPVGAVRGIGRFSVPTCATHRLTPNSSCATQCLSRLACPIAPEHRYPSEQIEYHYTQSAQTLKQWFA